MLRLHAAPRAVLAIGAHPDDIEIGAGGLLLTIAATSPVVRYLIMTGSPERHAEARAAAAAFLADAAGASGELSTSTRTTLTLLDLPEGRLPAQWLAVKETLETVARDFQPDLILAPWRGDAHQDHRTIAELVPTVFRDTLILGYEIPKWDGDLGQPSLYVPLATEQAHRKVALLHECFPSQAHRDWWDTEVFLGLARLRGMECRAGYAEAFHCAKASVDLSPAPPAPDAPHPAPEIG